MYPTELLGKEPFTEFESMLHGEHIAG